MAGEQIIADANHPVEIYYGSPLFSDLKTMVGDLGVIIFPEDKVETIPDPAMGLGSEIIVTRATKVDVTDAKVKKIYRTWQETIGDLIKEKKIDLLGQDSVSPDSNTKLKYGMNIIITRVAEVEVTEKETIDYKVIKKESVDVEKGQTEIERAGEKGEKEVTYIVKRVDGVEVSKTVKDTKVTKEPVNQILIIGIGPKYAKSGPYKDTINAAAREYLINGTALMCLMMQESGGDNYSTSTYGDVTYYGLFQYTDGFWASASAAAGYGGASIYDAEAQIFATARALTHGQAGRWPPWGGCADR